jgi:N-acetylglucosamine kinase-like BadF-type ATPase
LLLDEAAAGDPVAGRIVREQGTQIGSYALAAARKVGLERAPYAMVLAGGIFRHASHVLPDAIIECVRRMSADITPIRSPFEPVVGALMLAIEAAGAAVGTSCRARLTSSLPPAMLFATEFES